EEVDLETAQITTTVKLPTLKQSEYDMWRLRIEQYFQVQDYALWDVIKNGNSFKPVAKTTTNAYGTSTTLIPGPVTTKEKVQKKNDMNARSMLLMSLPNKHLMTFNQYKDAKTLFAAIQTRFGGNEATKKTQKTLLKQMYENFSAPSTESLDSILTGFRRFTNEVNTAYGVSTANTQVSPASTQGITASTQDLEQIHEDDIEEMDLKWHIALLSMRTRRFFQKTCRKITINGSDTIGYDKSKVECFNYSSRRTVNVEETSSKAMLAINGAGFDWSYMADDEVPINMALMAFSDSEFNKSEFNLENYKSGLPSVEEQLVFYKKNEVIFCEQLVVLKRDISYKDSEISMLKSVLEKLKQEKESNQLKIEEFDNASKSLDKLIGSQIPDKCKKGLGFVSYNAVSPPPTGLFLPPNLDLSNFGLEEFQPLEFEGYGPKTSKNVSKDISNEVRESPDAPLIEKLVSDDKLEKKTVFPTVVKIEFGTYPISQTSRNLMEDMLPLEEEPKEGKLLVKELLKLLADESQVFLKVPRKNNMYSVDMKNIVSKESLTCLVTKVTLNESMLWHRRLGHVNFKTINKLVKENLVRGLPTKHFKKMS
ncbi:ribonuclease H-like domain-containing protein, partial [Tanacetum coccineum]